VSKVGAILTLADDGFYKLDHWNIEIPREDDARLLEGEKAKIEAPYDYAFNRGVTQLFKD